MLSILKSILKNGPPEITKDWDYNRQSHLDYLTNLGKKENYSDWHEKTKTVATTLLLQLKKNYKNGYNKDLKTFVCADMTKDDELFPEQSYWTDLVFLLEEDAEIYNIIKELNDMGYPVKEDAVYYNPLTNSFFVTLFRSIDNNGPDIYQYQPTFK